MAPKVPNVKLNDGRFMPTIGFGTFSTDEGDVEAAVKGAIDAGYRFFDTAYMYGNEKEVGNGVRSKIEDGTVTREELFICTKVWSNFHRESQVIRSCKESLKNLGLSYVDLFLIHWPFALKDGDDFVPTDESGKWIFEDTDYLESWKGMEECVRQGLARSIGVSNFNSEQIKRILDSAKIKPVNNQVEVNVNFPNVQLIEFCKKHDVTVTAYSPLSWSGNKGVDSFLTDKKIDAIAKKYKKSAAQIALRFTHQLGAIPIPKSKTLNRIEENINIFDFKLTDEEMKAIKSVGNGLRTDAMEDAKDDKYYPFSIPY